MNLDDDGVMLKMVWLYTCCFIMFIAFLAFAFGSSKAHAHTAVRILDSAFKLAVAQDEDTTQRSNNSTIQRSNHSTRQRRPYISPYTKKLVAASQHWKCRICSRELDASYEIDHIVPHHRGGSNEMSNLEAICRSPCHISKSAREASRR